MAKSEYLKFVALTIFFVHSLNTTSVFNEWTKSTVVKNLNLICLHPVRVLLFTEQSLC